MTQEEKARAYDEALERARNLYDGVHKGCKEVIDNIFPELTESEDERIRRTLVEYFGPKVQLDFVRGVPIKKIRDWLEKQKEREPMDLSEMMVHKTPYIAPVPIPISYLEKQKEQKPAEWSEEDKLSTELDEWSSFRREAAKDILCALAGNKDYLKVIGRIEPETMLAIRFADELIKQLKEETK